MGYIKMSNGSIIADVFDSPETIANAEKCGYTIVKEQDIPKVEKPKETPVKDKTESEEKPIHKKTRK